MNVLFYGVMFGLKFPSSMGEEGAIYKAREAHYMPTGNNSSQKTCCWNPNFEDASLTLQSTNF